MYFIKYKRVLLPTNCKNHNWVVWSFRKCFVNVFVLFFFCRRFEPWAKWGLTNPKWQPWPLVNLPINSKRKEFYLSEKNRRAFSEGTKVSRSINAWIFSYFFPCLSHLVPFCRPMKIELLLILSENYAIIVPEWMFIDMTVYRPGQPDWEYMMSLIFYVKFLLVIW